MNGRETERISINRLAELRARGEAVELAEIVWAAPFPHVEPWPGLGPQLRLEHERRKAPAGEREGEG